MKNIIQVVNIEKYMAIIRNRMASALGLSLLFLTILVSCSKSTISIRLFNSTYLYNNLPPIHNIHDLL